MATLEQARSAKNSVLAQNVSELKEVNGIGICSHAQGYALKVNLLAPAKIPTEIYGVPIITDDVDQAEPAQE